MKKLENAATLPADADTGFFRMSQSAFVRMLAGKYIPVAIPVAAAVVIGGIAGALFDVRVIILALMALLIIAPMLMAFLYFNYALKPGCVANTLNHCLSFSQEEIRVEITPRPLGDDDKQQTVIQRFDIATVSRINASSSAITIILGGKEDGFIWIPYSAFLSPDHLKHSLATLGDKRYAEFASVRPSPLNH